MRRYLKNQILSILDSMEMANLVLIENFKRDDYAAANQLLEDLQASAIQIGTTIEQFEGEATETVHLLEEYCELVYQLSQAGARGDDPQKFISALRHQLSGIINSVKYQIRDSKSVVLFLPYKASMWDSMESVWKAAKEDETCECYVIPIPYFDKNPDGSLGEMHYEGREYPNYVQITSWEEYNIAANHPDVIYIHNPYDDHNRVTSIHPNFYSKVLKKHTNMLVYIPYFVCMDDVPKHFCVLPGTMHANRVIVQSDKVRQTYIREFHKLEEENNCRGVLGNAEEKFQALGSPKFDKVLSTKVEAVGIPEEWSRLIERPDGSRKKVIFFNTTISALLKWNEKYLSKLENTLKVFRGNTEVVLLWRPHPLNEATCEAMRPELFKRYKELVERYKQEKFGIYDDTPDMNRAIAISDGYYGDKSSVVALFEAVGKPVMISNIQFENNIIKRESEVRDANTDTGSNQIKIIYEDMAVVNNYGYVAAMNFNGLFKINTETNSAEFISMFPNEIAYKKRLFIVAKSYQDKVIFVPSSGKDIVIFDTITCEITSIPVPEPEIYNENYNVNAKFTEAVIYKDNVYCVCATYPGILKLNMGNYSVEVLCQGLEKEVFLFRKGICREGIRIFASSVVSNLVLEFNMEEELITIRHIGDGNKGAWGIIHDTERNCFWLTPKVKGPIICWDKDSDTIHEYFDYPSDFAGGDFWFTKGYLSNGNLYLLPGDANMAIRFDLKYNKFYPEGNIACKEGISKWFLYENENYLYYIDFSKELTIYKDQNISLKRLDKANNTVTDQAFPAISNRDDYLGAVLKARCDEKWVLLKEGNTWNLRLFINNVATYGAKNAINQNPSDCGEKIHSYIMRCLT